MFNSIFAFELRYRLTRPATYVYFFIFLLATFLATSTDSITIGGANGKVHINAPVVINTVAVVLSVFGLFVSSAVMGVPVYRDLEHKTHTFFFSLPFSKNAYLGGRYLGSFVVLVGIFLSLGLGIMLGAAMPWVDKETVGPFNILSYLNSYVLFLIPNLFITGSIFFALVALTRNIVAAYTGSAILFVIYIISVELASEMDNQRLAALLDPFGFSTAQYITKYWTVAERNTLQIPLTNELLINRVIWLGISGLILLLTFTRFNYSTFLGTTSRKSKNKPIADEAVLVKPDEIRIPRVSQYFSTGLHFRQMVSLASLEFKNIVRDVLFLSILLAGVIFLFLDGWYADEIFGTRTFPVTYYMVQTREYTFAFLAYGILIFFSGELVWRDRSLKVAQITDTLPTPNWLSLASKFIAMALIAALLCVVTMVAGILVQTVKGYFNYEIGLYLTELFLITFPEYLLIAALCFFVHTLVNNKFLGFFVTIALIFTLIVLSANGFNHRLYQYARIPGYTYSDMNGYGHSVEGTVWFMLYWGLFAFLLIIIANLLWNRGTETNFRSRLRVAGDRLSGVAKRSLTLVLVLWLATGVYAYYNTNILNEYRRPKKQNAQLAEYEKKYKKYEGIAQPKITQVKLNADLYPEDLRADIRGNFVLKNKSSQAIDSLHVMITKDVDIAQIRINGKLSEPILADRDNNYYIYALQPALQPSQELAFDFDIALTRKGFTNSQERSEIVYNGSFFNSNVCPSFGYSVDAELSDNKERKKLDLPERKRVPLLEDSIGRMRNYISQDGDWIDYEAVVSTSPDQIAISPGYLQKEWTENGRRYFHYKMDAPILSFYSILSARYEVLRDQWQPANGQGQPVNIEIYYHKGHEYNLDRMVKSVKRSLDYYAENFSPYQFRQARIMEFPRYAQFAQAFSNTIPYSEGIGFIAKVDDSDEKNPDVPFYVTAHEMGHQWWAHQVIGSYNQGATLMSESMAEYSALMVMEKEYGRDRMKRFLKYDLDRYLRGRAAESEKELPLYRVENQDYVHYRKGSLIMYALKDYIGEEQLNAALKKYLQKVAFQEAPYTNSLEFLSYIEEATPDSLHYLIEDWFRKITLYENRVTAATYESTTDNQYKVTLALNSKKYYADSLGNETEAPLREWIDIGVFTEEEKDGKKKEIPLYMKKHQITEGQSSIEVVVKEKPIRAGIDPYNKLIDRNPDDNTMAVSPK